MALNRRRTSSYDAYRITDLHRRLLAVSPRVGTLLWPAGGRVLPRLLASVHGEVHVPLGVAALVLAPKLVPESRAGSARRRYDPFGAVSITAAVLVFVYAIAQAPQAGWAAAQTVVMLCAGAALLAVFCVIETKVGASLLPLPLFRLVR